MAVPLSISTNGRDGRAWRRIEIPHVRVSGVWQPCQKVWARDAGVWREVFVDADREISVTNQTAAARRLSAGSLTVTAQYRILSDGRAQTGINNTGSLVYTDISQQWKRFDYSRTFEAKWQKVSGTLGTFTGPAGESENVWFTINGTDTWQNTRTGLDFTPTLHVFDIFLRELGGSELDSARITLSVEKEDTGA